MPCVVNSNFRGRVPNAGRPYTVLFISAMASRNDVELAAPGQRLGSAVDLLPGEGAYVYGEHVFASAVGHVERTAASGQGVQVCITNPRAPSPPTCANPSEYLEHEQYLCPYRATSIRLLSAWCRDAMLTSCHVLTIW
jgi:hypothetical protein